MLRGDLGEMFTIPPKRFQRPRSNSSACESFPAASADFVLVSPPSRTEIADDNISDDKTRKTQRVNSTFNSILEQEVAPKNRTVTLASLHMENLTRCEMRKLHVTFGDQTKETYHYHFKG